MFVSIDDCLEDPGYLPRMCLDSEQGRVYYAALSYYRGGMEDMILATILFTPTRRAYPYNDHFSLS